MVVFSLSRIADGRASFKYGVVTGLGSWMAHPVKSSVMQQKTITGKSFNLVEKKRMVTSIWPQWALTY